MAFYKGSTMVAGVGGGNSGSTGAFDYANMIYKDNVSGGGYASITFSSSEITAAGQIQIKIVGSLNITDEIDIDGTSVAVVKTLGSATVINPAFDATLSDSETKFIKFPIKKGQSVTIALASSACGAAYLPYASA